MQRITMDEIVFCHTHKQFHLSHVTVADPESILFAFMEFWDVAIHVIKTIYP